MNNNFKIINKKYKMEKKLKLTDGQQNVGVQWISMMPHAMQYMNGPNKWLHDINSWVAEFGKTLLLKEVFVNQWHHATYLNQTGCKGHSSWIP